MFPSSEKCVGRAAKFWNRNGLWRTPPAEGQILETVFLNFTLDDVSLCYEIEKPFDALAKGLLVSSNRGDRIRTCDFLVPNQAL